ncbi:MAG TPA: cysteine desulfurase family protein [Stellaceae bacterium]|nr:cysteine desulfurase family protein [Stellaceae bacterium]
MRRAAPSRRNSSGLSFWVMTGKRETYLDWNANAPMRAEAIEAVARALPLCGNPSSVHRFGRRARQAIEAARESVAALINAAAEDVVFTSGGTEANNLALKGFPERRVLVSAIEHDSVLAAVPEATRIPVRPSGVIDLAALETLLAEDKRPALVSVMFANNETGVIQPAVEIARIAHAHHAVYHCDAVQGPGKAVVDFRAIGADLMTISAHKIGGPMGIGALIARNDLALKPLVAGGGQERGRRGGTENFPGIVGFGAAAKLAAAEASVMPRVATLRDRAQHALQAAAPAAKIFGVEAVRLPNTLCIAMPGVAAATQVMALDLGGVMVSAGAACSAGKVTRSHVLDAMGVPRVEAECAIRITLGWSTEAADIDHLIEAWTALYARSQASAA